MNILNPMIISIIEPGLAMFENFDVIENMAGSHSICSTVLDYPWDECNFITQTLLNDAGFYNFYAFSLWDAASLQLKNHTGPIEDLSRTTIALLKFANYDTSGIGPVIGGLNWDNLSLTNRFNSQNVTYAQVKPYLIECAEWYKRREHYADAFRRARYQDAMGAFRRR